MDDAMAAEMASWSRSARCQPTGKEGMMPEDTRRILSFAQDEAKCRPRGSGTEEAIFEAVSSKDFGIGLIPVTIPYPAVEVLGFHDGTEPRGPG